MLNQNSDWPNPIWTGIKNNNRLCIFFQDSEKTDSYIARSIIDVALSLKSEENKMSISIAPRNDNLNNKASELKNQEIWAPIDIHRIPIQFIYKIVDIEQANVSWDVKPFFLLEHIVKDENL